MAIQSQSYRVFFDGDNISTTGYIYNDSNGNNATTGWIDAKGEYVVVQVCVATLTDIPNMQYRIEGKFPRLDRSASIVVANITGAHTIDKLHNISERIEQVRIGARLGRMVSSPLSSPCNFYAGLCVSEET